MPTEDLGDWILTRLHKRKAVFFVPSPIPTAQPHFNVCGIEESFCRAILGPETDPIPKGSAEVYQRKKERSVYK